MRWRFAAAVALLGALRLAAAAADDATLSGKDIFEGACASCHGVDGRGAPSGTAIAVPLPDFTDCNFITREGDGNWAYLIAHGGEAFGLSPQMPAFGDALTGEQIQAVLDFIRSFCDEPRWPSGELNFRRALFTTKAFPEDEALLLPDFVNGRAGARDWTTELALERRVGARGEIEVGVPFAVHDVTGGATTTGFGDVGLAYKQVLYASRPHLAIVSGSLDLVLPSGDRQRGLGSGTVSFEPALLAGKQLDNFVVQAQLLGEAPVDERRADRAVRYRLALSYPLGALRRAWVPTVELEALQNVTAGQHHFFVTPQIYKGLTQRGHVAVAIGAQLPVAGDGEPFEWRVSAFLLWEYTDGGLWW
jgi:mono/diheme cytochrome c family protein